jgi:hypothetical protein
MEGRSNLRLRRKEREALREQWIQQAGRAFERMFGNANQDQLVTFAEREDMACALGKELTTFLLQKHVATDSHVRLPQKGVADCPTCQKPGERVTQQNDKLPDRDLTTRAGQVKLEREQWWCNKCRRVFFSVRPQAETGDGGIQPARLANGGSAGEQGGVV